MSSAVCCEVARNSTPLYFNRRAALFRHRFVLALHTSPISSSPPLRIDKFQLHIYTHSVEMRWLFSFLFSVVSLVAVQARSFTGNRLLVVLEDQTEREKYSVFLEDLTCKFTYNSYGKSALRRVWSFVESQANCFAKFTINWVPRTCNLASIS